MDKIDPWRAARHGRVFQGEASLEEMPRLAEAVVGLVTLGRVGTHEQYDAVSESKPEPAPGKVRFALRLGVDEQGRTLLSGAVQAVVCLICQRCLAPLELALDLPISMALLVGEAQAQDLPAELDPWVVNDDGLLSPLEVVEDELLLAIPLIPRHAPGACAQAATDPRPDPGPPHPGERAGAFAELATLLKATKH